MRSSAPADRLTATEFIDSLSSLELDAILRDWQLWARDDQLPPKSTPTGAPWRTWLILGGRGSGKTRAGAEWVRAHALGEQPIAAQPAPRIALVGETMAQVRSVMVEGLSGILSVHSANERPTYEPSLNQITWPNGSIAQMFSAEDPDSLRGPQFMVAWCDELAKWRYPELAWDMLQFALRLGENPQSVITTTPRGLNVLNRLLIDPLTVVTRSPTLLNVDNLAPSFYTEITRRYANTMLGRQELDGEIIDALGGSLFRSSWINQSRIHVMPELRRIVVAVDPPITAKASSDSCGICVAGIGLDGRAFVLADRSIQGREPIVWAKAAVAAYRDFAADRIVAEGNQGGDLVTTVLRQVDPNVPVKIVRASRGKWVRAEPVAALYAEGRVVHVGEHALLEHQMITLGPDGRVNGKSPDRLDALVWAITELMLAPDAPSVRSL